MFIWFVWTKVSDHTLNFVNMRRLVEIASVLYCSWTLDLRFYLRTLTTQVKNSKKPNPDYLQIATPGTQVTECPIGVCVGFMSRVFSNTLPAPVDNTCEPNCPEVNTVQRMA